jgi:pimeloyl-ACP methyl ester carboxylesterase
MSKPVPFTLHVPDAAIADLRERLARARFPDQAGEPWAYGSDVGYMRALVRYWQNDFDWRAAEAQLNALPQYKVPLHGIDLHLIHVPGKGPNPCPLLLSHGWPGSVLEFLEIIPRLTDPARFGVEAIAECFAELMTVLGYRRFAAQGGDWGAFVTSRLGHAYAERMIGIHLNLLPLRRDPAMIADPTRDERVYLEELKVFLKEETGYQWIQGTRPQTLAFALTDSPVGLAAWIVEKFRAWSDCGGDLESVFTKDQLLANIALYWFTGAIGASFWPYYARMHGPWPIPDGATIDAPTGYAAFPREILRRHVRSPRASTPTSAAGP